MPGQRPTYVEIDLEALAHNYTQIRNQLSADNQLLAVVKADAYGHGVEHVVPALIEAGTEWFGVALVEEGVELRQAGVTQPILVLGGVWPEQIDSLLRFELTPALYSLEIARKLNERAVALGGVGRYHLKVDSGMGRLGFLPGDLPNVLAELQSFSALQLEGVFTHFALADEPGHAFNDVQVARFREALDAVRAAGFKPSFVHASNSAAHFALELPECNLIRPGIALYGALPSEAFRGLLDLQPVMSFRSRVAQLKDLPADYGVSYSHRFVTERPSRIAAIPVGYADGYNRMLTNRGRVLVRGHYAPVVGTVCMDWIMIDVSDVPGVEVGDEVTLLGRENGHIIWGEEWAEKIGTIAYEVFCAISKRVPRFKR
mgnify:CR=1 FL=1